jgi:hypothetical protein
VIFFRSFKFKKPGSGLNLNKKSIEVAELNIPSVPTINNNQHKDFPCVPPKSSKQLGSYPSTQTKSCDQSRSYAITINDLDDDFDSALPPFKPTNQNVGTFNTTNQSKGFTDSKLQKVFFLKFYTIHYRI